MNEMRRTSVEMPDGVRISVRESGSGPPLLLVHGFPVSGAMWDHVIPGLARVARCIVPDLRGFGASDVPRASRDISIATYADDLARVLDGLGESRPTTVIGLSMGGIIAFEFYRRHRDRVRALVLSNTRANAETAEGARRREERAQLAETQGAGGVRDIARAMLETLVAPEASDATRAELRSMMETCAPEALAAGSRALGSRRASWETLAALEVPACFIVGAQDAITPPDLHGHMFGVAQRSRAQRPGAPPVALLMEVIPGAGHVPPMETPEAWCRAVSRFLHWIGV